MSSQHTNQPVLIHDIVVKSDKLTESTANISKTSLIMNHFDWVSRHIPSGPYRLAKLSSRARLKRETELANLYQRFRKHA